MKIIHKEGKFDGKGGIKLYYQFWKPEQVKAVMVAAHGLAEYSERYTHVADHFANEGIAFYALDHRGHGLSEGIRGYIDSFDDYLDDLDTFIDMVKQSEKGKKIILLGHSLGGTIAIAYALKNPKKINYLILSSPGLKLASELDPELVKAILELSKNNPTQELPNQIDPYNLSHDKQLCEKYDKDPLVFKTITARFAVEFFTTMEDLLKNADKLKVPTLLLVAGDDKLVSPEGSKEFAKRVKEKDFKMKIYDGFYHELFNEVEKEKVFKDVDAWLKTRI
ncbi:MAG: lysophospholipase [Candidatus Jordarchaeum sp.]|uniref:alpha/beta hydrolase n=1 Tax=Candidatus Jordarchaeum sp. TaxID=2823881 RepID=UPI00404A0D0F